MRKTLFVTTGFVLVCFLVGCATSYQSSGLTGGYSDTQLAADEFRVHFEGNALTENERSQDFCLLRAAELTLQNGFKYFVLVDESGGRVYSAYKGHVTSSPSNQLRVRCYKSKPEGVVSYDAAFLQQSLKQKYKITN